MRVKFWKREKPVTVNDVKDCLKSEHGFKQSKIDKLIECGLNSKINNYIKTYDLTSAGCAAWIADWVEESYLLDVLATTGSQTIAEQIWDNDEDKFWDKY